MAVVIALLALLALIFFVPYGVDVAYRAGEVRLGVRAGPFTLRLLPARPKSPQREEKARRRKAKKKARQAGKKAAASPKPGGEKKPKKKPDAEFILALVKMGARALRRLWCSLRIDYLQFHCIVASRDPFDTATYYSRLCSVVNALPGLVGEHVHVRRQDVQLGADFETDRPQVQGRLILTIQLYRLVVLGAAFALEFLRWKRQHHRTNPATATERMNDIGTEQDRRNHGRDNDQDQAVG